MIFSDIIDGFFKGETNLHSGTKTAPGNLFVTGDQLIHYSTPMVERYGDSYIVNLTQYSIQTGRVQKMIKEKLVSVPYRTARRVPRDYKGSLVDYIIE